MRSRRARAQAPLSALRAPSPARGRRDASCAALRWARLPAGDQSESPLSQAGMKGRQGNDAFHRGSTLAPSLDDQRPLSHPTLGTTNDDQRESRKLRTATSKARTEQLEPPATQRDRRTRRRSPRARTDPPSLSRLPEKVPEGRMRERFAGSPTRLHPLRTAQSSAWYTNAGNTAPISVALGSCWIISRSTSPDCGSTR